MSLTREKTYWPTGFVQYRCIYCNCQFITDHVDDSCRCDIEVCPNAECPSHSEEVGR